MPFTDVYALPTDEAPFDLTDIVEAHKERQAELRAQGWERASVLTLAQRCTAWTRL